MEKLGQLSPDGSYYWDSQRWVSTLSTDGNWRWNGKVWAAVDPPDDTVHSGASANFLSELPGLRSRSPWKIAVAAMAYLVIALFIAAGLAPVSLGGFAFRMGALIAVLVASNGWGLRERLPLFRSSNRWLAALAWAGLMLLVLTAVVTTQLAAPKTGEQGQVLHATAPSPSGSPAQTASASPSPRQVSPISPKSISSPYRFVAPRPTPQPSPTPPPPPPGCGAPTNPFGYDFCAPVSLIYRPASGFCRYFKCVALFWKSTGFVVECVDGTYSHAGGLPAACAIQGGMRRPLSS